MEQENSSKNEGDVLKIGDHYKIMEEENSNSSNEIEIIEI